MSKVIRLETGGEPEWFFDLEDEKNPQDSSKSKVRLCLPSPRRIFTNPPIS